MNNSLTLFTYQGMNLRTSLINGEPWFVAKDVCEVLDITNSRDALNRIDEDEKGVVLTDTHGGKQEVTAVNEPGLYSLILGSRKAEAKQFKRWITHEVIPAIRKHGGYLTPEKVEEALLNPDTIIQLATQLKEARAKIEADRAKVIFAEALETSNHSILIGELAKLLKQNGIEIGQNRLFDWMRQEGYLGSKGEYYNVPTQKGMDLKLFEIKTRSINNPDGSVRVTRTTKVTTKGQMYFINKFKKVTA